MLKSFQDLEGEGGESAEERRLREPVPLSAKELALLEKLTRNKTDVDWQEVRMQLMTQASCAHLRRQWEFLKRHKRKVKRESDTRKEKTEKLHSLDIL